MTHRILLAVALINKAVCAASTGQDWVSLDQTKQFVAQYAVSSIKEADPKEGRHRSSYRILLFDGFGFTSIMIEKTKIGQFLVYESSRRDELRKTNVIERVVIELDTDKYKRLLEQWGRFDAATSKESKEEPKEDSGFGIIELSDVGKYQSKLLSGGGDFGIRFYDLLNDLRKLFHPRLNK